MTALVESCMILTNWIALCR